MTQTEEIQEAIKHLDKAIDTFSDKDNEIRAYNDAIDGIICTLKYIIRDFSRYE
jgi:ABC-type transporter Mla subunit MlaD